MLDKENQNFEVFAMPKPTAYVLRQPKKMTNKEWLITLTNKELADFIINGLPKMSRCSTQSSAWIEEWLGKEHQEDGYEQWFVRKEV